MTAPIDWNKKMRAHLEQMIKNPLPKNPRRREDCICNNEPPRTDGCRRGVAIAVMLIGILTGAALATVAASMLWQARSAQQHERIGSATLTPAMLRATRKDQSRIPIDTTRTSR